MNAPIDSRHVRPWGDGLLAGLALARDSVSRRLLVHLLLSGEPQPLDFAVFAEALSADSKAVAKAMFELNRLSSITVLETKGDEAPWHHEGLMSLSREMEALMAPQQGILLASADGLLIAMAGCVEEEQAHTLAAQIKSIHGDESALPLNWEKAELHVNKPGLIWLSSHPLDVRHPSWLRLQACLLFAHGELEG